MIQFNLLPDVKLEYIKAQRTKRLVISIAGVVIAACFVVILLLVGAVYGLQRTHLSNLDEDIEKYTTEIEETPQINRILTVQNQLSDINELHANKPVTSRLFEYIGDVTPANVSINRLEVDLSANTVELAGETEDLATVNKFVDTLKFIKYVIEEDNGNEVDDEDSDFEDDNYAFNDVVLSSFGRTANETSYTITFAYNPIIFDSSFEVSLDTENRITTRSEIDRPEPLFRTPEELEDGED